MGVDICNTAGGGLGSGEERAGGCKLDVRKEGGRKKEGLMNKAGKRPALALDEPLRRSIRVVRTAGSSWTIRPCNGGCSRIVSRSYEGCHSLDGNGMQPDAGGRQQSPIPTPPSAKPPPSPPTPRSSPGRGWMGAAKGRRCSRASGSSGRRGRSQRPARSRRPARAPGARHDGAAATIPALVRLIG